MEWTVLFPITKTAYSSMIIMMMMMMMDQYEPKSSQQFLL
jgi:hypothetical protein